MVPWFSLIAVAHGPPAAVLGVASYDDDGPVHVVLTEGLAVRAGSSWRYVCPTRWGGLALAPFAAGDSDAVWLPGWDDVYRVDSAGSAEPMGDPTHAVTDLLDLDGTAGVWTIYVGGTSREIARLGADPLSFSGGPTAWSGVAGADTGPTLVAARDGLLVQGVLEVESGVIQETVHFPLVGTGPQWVVDGAVTWLLDRASGYVGVHRLPDGMLVAQATNSVEGPLRVGDVDVVALDEVLYALGADGPRRLPEARPIGCLASGGAARWACSGDLYALTSDARLGDPVVALAGLAAPVVADLSAAETVDCWGEWRTFALDLGIDPGPMPEAGASGPIVASGGCGAIPGGRGVSGLFAALIAILIRRPSRGPVSG